MPVLAGYCAARGQLDTGAVLVLAILIIWQMPHFYAIAMYRRDDYKAAGIPVLTVAKGMKAARLQIFAYIIAFIVACAALSFYGYTGFSFLVIMTILGIAWLLKGLQNYDDKDKLWGRKMFLFSLIVIMITSVMLSIGARLP
jgi:protoheme IX farnesyltransferase